MVERIYRLQSGQGKQARNPKRQRKESGAKPFHPGGQSLQYASRIWFRNDRARLCNKGRPGPRQGPLGYTVARDGASWVARWHFGPQPADGRGTREDTLPEKPMGGTSYLRVLSDHSLQARPIRCGPADTLQRGKGGCN